MSKLQQTFNSLLGIFLVFQVAAQPPGPPPSPNDTLQSTRVLPDGSVVFGIYAPKATQVTVGGDFAGIAVDASRPFSRENAMTVNEDGVWTYTTQPLPADAYSYVFTVDGVRTLDPLNTLVKESENSLSNYFILPGTASEYCQNLNIPHGTVEKVWFHSTTTGKMTRFHVYTPPGYESMTEQLPVLVLQHGGGDNDASWATIGRANFIMDNLYAENKAKPMVIVMPMGHPTEGFFMGLGVEEDPYYRQLFDEILPLVRKKYRVKDDRYQTAFAGLSMGGLQALNIALFAPEKFGYVLPLSTGYFEAQRKLLEEEHTAALKNPEINKLRLFWIAMGGESDIAYRNGLEVNKIFDKYGIQYETNTYDAGHTFITWRHNLREFAPLLFR
ncbi:esterase [Flavilitoribacter nigricans]|uniref:Esterase n=1 Tax=Flavilitoribacter nigricans (strain ATCC 23147 / DSM 23189 / NBRC 102662 / NCIMB 1420 / SS-2) TaxID=1122177 RepID=A0A2D0NGD0_FLAN2|nr:esterase [Flavilitoribacter nigricans]PHN06823.1 esterase [Flavilitoribacter nigricans DSM 23189 = NBRC 102662]